MDIIFNNKNLEKLYNTGKSSKYKLEKKVILSFFEVVAALESSNDIYDLWKIPSLNLERLKGHKNRYSARIDRKYRLEMSIDWQNEKMTIGIIGIEELSKHYGG